MNLEPWEKKWEEDDECGDDPDDQDPFVANVEEREAHVRRQLLHRLNELLHRQLEIQNSEMSNGNKVGDA